MFLQRLPQASVVKPQSVLNAMAHLFRAHLFVRPPHSLRRPYEKTTAFLCPRQTILWCEAFGGGAPMIELAMGRSNAGGAPHTAGPFPALYNRHGLRLPGPSAVALADCRSSASSVAAGFPNDKARERGTLGAFAAQNRRLVLW